MIPALHCQLLPQTCIMQPFHQVFRQARRWASMHFIAELMPEPQASIMYAWAASRGAGQRHVQLQLHTAHLVGEPLMRQSNRFAAAWNKPHAELRL